MDFEVNPQYIEQAAGMFVERKSRNLRITPQKVAYTVSYKQWNGTYYINHIRGDLHFKIKKRRCIFGGMLIPFCPTGRPIRISCYIRKALQVVYSNSLQGFGAFFLIFQVIFHFLQLMYYRTLQIHLPPDRPSPDSAHRPSYRLSPALSNLYFQAYCGMPPRDLRMYP